MTAAGLGRFSKPRTAAAAAGRFNHPDALAVFLERPQADDQIGAVAILYRIGGKIQH
jgi:hypothetical protein